MAKGDLVEVVIEAGGAIQSVHVRATKAGRTVRTRSATSAGIKWFVIEEMTKTGKPTGNVLRVRHSSIVSVSEVKQQEEVAPKKKRASTVTEPLGLV